MKVQSLSIDVPTNKGICVNKCPFCCSRTHVGKYESLLLDDTKLAYGEKMFKRRLEFAKDEGVNNVILTGEIEPMQNMQYLKTFGHINWTLDNPFHWIEIQTTGYGLNEKSLTVLSDAVGVSTISLSVVDPFSSENNKKIVGLPQSTPELPDLTKLIKEMGFNLRISLNLTKHIEYVSFATLFTHLKETLHADQVTMRKLYISPNNTEEDTWININQMEKGRYQELKAYIESNGRPLELLPFGARKYACDGLTTVIDDDCMASKITDKEDLKYLILRPNCKLYTRWDLKESLLF